MQWTAHRSRCAACRGRRRRRKPPCPHRLAERHREACRPRIQKARRRVEQRNWPRRSAELGGRSSNRAARGAASARAAADGAVGTKARPQSASAITTDTVAAALAQSCGRRGAAWRPEARRGARSGRGRRRGARAGHAARRVPRRAPASPSTEVNASWGRGQWCVGGATQRAPLGGVHVIVQCVNSVPSVDPRSGSEIRWRTPSGLEETRS